MNSDIKLVTSAYYNIEEYPHYGSGRKSRLKRTIANIANNTGLPIVCYTSKLHGCYEHLGNVLDERKISNVELKIFELEEHPLHEPILNIRQNSEKYLMMYEKRPILIYWLKFEFVLRELANHLGYLYWIDGGLSHNGMFPKRYAIDPNDRYGMTYENSTYNFSCFSRQAFENIVKFTEEDKIFSMVRHVSDADFNELMSIPELLDNYVQYRQNKDTHACWGENTQCWPIGGFFGGHTTKSKLKEYAEEFEKVSKIFIQNNKLIVDEGIMAYLNFKYENLMKRYHFENFLTEDEGFLPDIHWELDRDGNETGRIRHHFYRVFTDEPVKDFFGTT